MFIFAGHLHKELILVKEALETTIRTTRKILNSAYLSDDEKIRLIRDTLDTYAKCYRDTFNVDV